MAGLLQRAIPLHEQFYEIESIPLAEREKIYEEIEEVISKETGLIDKKNIRFIPRKNDRKLPFFVNASSFVLILSVSLILSAHYGDVEKEIISSSNVLNTTESQIITALKRDSELKLSEKERQIQQIRNEMDRLLQEQSRILVGSQIEIERLEKELRAKMDAQFLKETETLMGRNLNADTLERAISDLKSRLELSFINEKNLILQQAEEERLRKESELQTLIDEYSLSLVKAQEEKNEIEGNYNMRYQELEARLILENESILTEYNSLLNINQNEKFILNQISEAYREIAENIATGNYSEANRNISSLEGFIENEDFLLFPNVASRKSTDEVLLSSLRDLITKDDNPGSPSVVPPPFLEEITNYVNRGNTFFDQGFYQEAKESYLKAYALFPPIEQGYDALREMEQRTFRIQNEEFSQHVEKGDRQYAQNLFPSSLSSYQSALESITDHDQVVSRIVENLVDIGKISEYERVKGNLVSNEELNILNEAKIRVQDRYRLLSSLKEMENRIAGSEKSLPEEENLIEILSTKVYLKNVLASASVRKQYPEIHKTLDHYLEDYGTVRENKGRTAALREINDMMASIKTGQYHLEDPDDNVDLYLNFLASLEELIEKSDYFP